MGQTLQPLEDGNHRLVGEPGNLVVKENYWIRTDTGEAGNAVDFFVKIRGMSFIEGNTTKMPNSSQKSTTATGTLYDHNAGNEARGRAE